MLVRHALCRRIHPPPIRPQPNSPPLFFRRRGSNTEGQLGSVADAASHPAPQAVALAGGGALAGVARVTAGEGFACAWTAGGASAWCWGSDTAGKLGHGTSGGTSTGAVLVATPGGVAWAQVAAYADHACGLSAAGAAYCWGSAIYLGAGKPPLAVDNTKPVAVAAAVPGPQGWAWAGLSTGCNAFATIAVADAAGGASIYGWGARRSSPLLPPPPPPLRAALTRRTPPRAGSVNYYRMGNGLNRVDATSTVAYAPVRAGVSPCAACTSPATCNAGTGVCG